MKICTKCNKLKDECDFYQNNSYTTGICSRCKECIKLQRKIYRENNKKKIAKYKKDNYVKQTNRIKVSEEDKKKRKKERRKKYRKRRAELQKERLNSDPLFKLKRNLRNRVWAIMKGGKSKSTEELLGASFENAKSYIKNTFKEGMTWENYGEWHVDHKIPLASATSKEKLEELFHYTNLQALWAAENSSKKDKIL